MVIEAATLCLALNVFFEARSEYIPGQYAVAQVTLNRAGRDKAKVCTEVFKHRQFSWTLGVRREGDRWIIPSVLMRAVREEPEAWALAWRVAEVSLYGRMEDLTKGSTHYHARYVAPAWRRAFEPTKVLGQHVFYRAGD